MLSHFKWMLFVSPAIMFQAVSFSQEEVSRLAGRPTGVGAPPVGLHPRGRVVTESGQTGFRFSLEDG